MTIRSWGTKALRPLFEKLWPEIRVQKIAEVGDVQIWTVHGEKLRSASDGKGNHPFIDFTQGGNDQAYPWLPKNLIIVDVDATRGEIDLTKLHELSERNEMAEAGANYDIGKHPAHEYANSVEGQARGNPEKYHELWMNEANRALKMQGRPAMDEQPDRNGLIAQAEDKIESQLTPDNARDYRKIVTAGMAYALKGGPNSIMAKLKDSKDPVHDAAVGAVNLCLLMRKQSRGTMPLKAMAPACTTLALKAIEFAERAGMIQVDEKTVGRAVRINVDHLLRAFGLTPQRIHTAAQNIHAMTQDPLRMAKIRQAAGMEAAPNAEIHQPEGNA